MQAFGIIPSRFASSRFPGKPLVMINGMTMIERVYVQACKAKSLQKVIVATDNNDIYNAVKSFGGNVMMTSADHQSGTDRCAEILQKEINAWNVVVNIQGDEPFIDPQQIDLLVSCFTDPSVEIATLVKKINNAADLLNPNTPKVILDQQRNAIYFSRQAIPFLKGISIEKWLEHGDFYKHIGIYGYRTSTLLEISKLAKTNLEVTESLEQLRWIENGYIINAEITALESISIDTPDDLLKIKSI